MRQIKEILRTDDTGAQYADSCNTPQHSAPVFGLDAGLRARSFMANFTNFAMLPAATAAALTDKLLITVGTGTEVASRSTAANGGGVNISTQATTPLTGDNVLLTPAANTQFIQAVNANQLHRFSTLLSLTSVADIVASVGLSELLTDADPTGTAGEGALFLADPGEAVTTGLTTAQHANWILAYKVAGVDTFAATSVPLVAARAYNFEIQMNSDLTASMYINGTLVGTSPALTAADPINPFIALETAADAQKSADVRFVEFGPTVVL